MPGFFLFFVFILAMVLQAVMMQVFIFLIAVLCFYRKISVFSNIFPFKTVTFLFVFTLSFHLFVRFETQWSMALGTLELWEQASFFTLRNINLFLIMTHLLKLISTTDIPLLLGRVNTRIKKRGMDFSLLMQPLVIALLYWEIIRDEFHSLKQLHRILGLEKPKKINERLKWYSGMILPLISASLERSEHLSIALTSRGFGAD